MRGWGGAEEEDWAARVHQAGGFISSSYGRFRGAITPGRDITTESVQVSQIGDTQREGQKGRVLVREREGTARGRGTRGA